MEMEINMKRFFILSALAAGLLLQTAPAALAGQIQVKMITSLGTIELELFPDKAPVSVANFLRYAKQGLYDNTIFHRVIPNFMIQGGGFDKDMKKQSNFGSIINEANNGLSNDVGTIAMARTSEPHSASNQFFINTSKNTFLNYQSKSARGWGYAVFGKVSKGMDVVRKIESVQTTQRNSMKNVPLMPVSIQQIQVIEWADETLLGPRKHTTAP